MEDTLGSQKPGDFNALWGAISADWLLWFSITVSLLWPTVHTLLKLNMKTVQDVIQLDHSAPNKIVLISERLFTLVAFEAPVDPPKCRTRICNRDERLGHIIAADIRSDNHSTEQDKEVQQGDPRMNYGDTLVCFGQGCGT